jgi:hypothetical protein
MKMSIQTIVLLKSTGLIAGLEWINRNWRVNNNGSALWFLYSSRPKDKFSGFVAARYCAGSNQLP